MLKVGLTGGIGVGKSTVSKVFALLEIPIYEADYQAKLLIENGFNSIDIFYTDSKNDISTAKIAKQIFWVTKGRISKIERNN